MIINTVLFFGGVPKIATKLHTICVQLTVVSDLQPPHSGLGLLYTQRVFMLHHFTTTCNALFVEIVLQVL